MKRIWFILAALIVYSGMFAERVKIGDLYYNLNDDNTAAVTYYSLSNTNFVTGDIIIPQTIVYEGETYSVTSIGENAFSGCEGLTSVTIPNSVTKIGWNAFYVCTGLTSIEIPNSVIEISSFAFARCSGLKSVTIPNSVTSIGNDAFYGCSGLTSVTIGNSVTSIGNDAFYGCSGLTGELVIPNSVTEIGSGAFEDCSGLTSIEIPNSVTEIGDVAFGGCSGLTSIRVESGNSNYASENGVLYSKKIETLICCPGGINGHFEIPNSVTEIGSGAFWGCSNLTSVEIPNSVTSIGFSAFRDCSGLTGELVIPNSVKEIGNYTFMNCSSLASVEIPTSVTEISEYAFCGCSRLTSVTIPNSVTSIGDCAFSDCSGLSSVTIPNSVTSIGDGSFSGCRSLTSVEIPNSVKEIGNYTFMNCSDLTSVTIGNSVTSIGMAAFKNCSNLTKVEIEDIEAWCNINFDKISSPSNDMYDYSRSSNPLYYAKHLYLAGKEITELIIPNSIKEIKAISFFYCEGLSSVVIPNSVTSIEREAFFGCRGLTRVTLGNSVTSIGISAFECDDSITEVRCFALVPPKAYQSSFTSYDAFLHVTQNASETYKTSTCWKNFKTIIFDLPEVIPATGIRISPSTPGDLKVGESLQLTAIVSPENATDKTVTWKSSNSSVATVNQQGFVTAVAPGTAVITASDAYGHSAKVTITVKEEDTPVEVPATGISITPTTPAEMNVGESLQLTAIVSPENATDKRVTWESSNNSVATVNQQGLVTAVAPGTAFIFATDAFGHNAFVVITVIANEENGVELIFDDSSNLHIFTVNGLLIKKNASQEDIDALTPGIYIIGGKKVIVK